MRKLIKNGQIVEDRWTVLPKAEDASHTVVPEGQVIVPLSVWIAQEEALSQREDVAVWIDSDEEIETLAEKVQRFPLIAVNFPSFRDGRGYSTARLLRERYDYTGEIRAIGDVLQDQLFYMHRCGFNSFALREDRSPEKALAALRTFTESYQAAFDQPLPLFRRRAAQGTEKLARTA